MTKLIVGNWKMNPLNMREAVKLARGLGEQKSDAEIVICPPFVWLGSPELKRSGVKMGAQDVFWENQGAYTGEISPAMLRGMGVEYVILGHSERRKLLNETDVMINRKLRASLAAGLKIILCVGEPKEVRDKGIAAAKKFVKEQLRAALKKIDFSSEIVVAYEPVWAIGTGRSEKPEHAEEMAIFIRGLLGPKARVLYGGSVREKNARAFLDSPSLSGALIGGASLNPQEFKKIIKVAKEK